ncbi:arginine deiminase type-4 [Diaporthe sp. PMI_573]|nr:arginine deiminase type-4 [Diaporthaceae sp. PMI_573]
MRIQDCCLGVPLWEPCFDAEAESGAHLLVIIALIAHRIWLRCEETASIDCTEPLARQAGIGAVQHLGGARDEINSGGNIETIPPFTFNGKAWPAGRVILGNHKDQKHHIYPLLQAQETQEPVLLDADWLVVGHVDEFLQFLPADNERGWVLMADDPRAAIKMLKDIQTAGHGSTLAISRKNDSEANECSKRIDVNIEILKRETGLKDDEILHIPAMFNSSSFGDDNSTDLKVIALFPGAVNNLVLSGFKTSVAPNPFGPVVEGRDLLSEAITNAYSKLGMKITFIDDWYTHHSFGGDVHCGTNTVRDMSAQWW